MLLTAGSSVVVLMLEIGVSRTESESEKTNDISRVYVGD